MEKEETRSANSLGNLRLQFGNKYEVKALSDLGVKDEGDLSDELEIADILLVAVFFEKEVRDKKRAVSIMPPNTSLNLETFRFLIVNIIDFVEEHLLSSIKEARGVPKCPIISA